MVLKVKKRADKTHTHPATKAVQDKVKKENLVRLNVQLSKEKRQALKVKAAEEGKTIHQVVNRLVDGYLGE